MEKHIKENLDHVGVPNADIKRPQWKTKKLPSPSKSKQKAQSNAFIGKMIPKEKPVKLPKMPEMGVDESLWIEKVEFEGDVYHVDDKAAKIFEYIKTLPYNSREIDYIKGCLKECSEFFDNFTQITERVRLWQLSKLRENIKKTNDYIVVLDEGSGMIDFNKADFSYLHEMVDKLPVNESDLKDPVSNKLQKLLGLKEWNKERAGEGRQLEIGTDKYKRYCVDLTPGQELELEQDKKRIQQTERYNKILSKIIASRSK